jgi:hypothetical protein
MTTIEIGWNVMPSQAHGSVLYRLGKAPSVTAHLGVQDKKDLHGKRDINQLFLKAM